MTLNKIMVATLPDGTWIIGRCPDVPYIGTAQLTDPMFLDNLEAPDMYAICGLPHSVWVQPSMIFEPTDDQLRARYLVALGVVEDMRRSLGQDESPKAEVVKFPRGIKELN